MNIETNRIMNDLAAIEAIRVLKSRYFRYVDTKDWVSLETLFTADIQFDRGHANAIFDPLSGTYDPPELKEPSIVNGREAVMGMIRNAVGPLRTVHHGFMPEIEITATDQATGIWAMRDELREWTGKLLLVGSGHYYETYKIKDGEWRIATVRLNRLWIERGNNIK